MTDEIKLQFVKEKETSNTIRYAEVENDEMPPQIKTLYVQKFAIKKFGNPDKISVKIAASD